MISNTVGVALLVIRNQRIGAFGSGPLVKVALSFRSRS